MTDDATLSDFFGSTDEDDEPDRERGDETAPVTDDDASDSGPIGAADLSTFAWGEYTCAECERETDRAWRDDGAYVCPDCKSW